MPTQRDHTQRFSLVIGTQIVEVPTAKQGPSDRREVAWLQVTFRDDRITAPAGTEFRADVRTTPYGTVLTQLDQIDGNLPPFLQRIALRLVGVLHHAMREAAFAAIDIDNTAGILRHLEAPAQVEALTAAVRGALADARAG
jgi:hypothetical protein